MVFLGSDHVVSWFRSCCFHGSDNVVSWFISCCFFGQIMLFTVPDHVVSWFRSHCFLVLIMLFPGSDHVVTMVKIMLFPRIRYMFCCFLVQIMLFPGSYHIVFCIRSCCLGRALDGHQRSTRPACSWPGRKATPSTGTCSCREHGVSSSRYSS